MASTLSSSRRVCRSCLRQITQQYSATSRYPQLRIPVGGDASRHAEASSPRWTRQQPGLHLETRSYSTTSDTFPLNPTTNSEDFSGRAVRRTGGRIRLGRPRRVPQLIDEELVPSQPTKPPKVVKSPPQLVVAPQTEKPSSSKNNKEGVLDDFNWYWESFPPTAAQKAQSNRYFNNSVKNAKLLRSFAQFRHVLESDVPEVCFVGRSNVGKSSLLNAIVNADIKSLLARTSSTPGFTKTMNFYGVGGMNGITIKKQEDGRDKIVGKNGLTIVDMPGYGEGSLSQWGVEIMKYIQSRKQLRRVFVLLDAQHGLKEKDRSILASLRLAGVSHQVILAKMDKLYIPQAKVVKRHDGKSLTKLKPKGTIEQLKSTMDRLREDISPPHGGGALGEIIGCSAETLVDGHRLGIDHVRYAVLKAAGLDELFQRR